MTEVSGRFASSIEESGDVEIQLNTVESNETKIDIPSAKKSRISLSRISEHINGSYVWIRVIAVFLVSICIIYFLILDVISHRDKQNPEQTVEKTQQTLDKLLKLLTAVGNGGR
jgi:hypothetical protein